MLLYKKKILLIDDDTFILDCLRTILKQNNFVVHTLKNGKKLSNITPQYDLLILDLWMSGESGFAICRKIKLRRETKHLPVILISANTDLDKIARKAGADDYLIKPFDSHQLLRKIDCLLRQKDATSAIKITQLFVK